MSLTLESSIFEYFCQLEDPRVNRTKLHKLIDIVAIAILAVEADSWEAIETFGQSKQNGSNSFSICRMVFPHMIRLLESSLVLTSLQQ